MQEVYIVSREKLRQKTAGSVDSVTKLTHKTTQGVNNVRRENKAQGYRKCVYCHKQNKDTSFQKVIMVPREKTKTQDYTT